MFYALLSSQPHSWFAVSVVGILVYAVYMALVGLVIVFLYRAAQFFGSATREQKLIRFEMSKLADEVQHLRERLAEDKDNHQSDAGSSDRSS